MVEETHRMRNLCLKSKHLNTLVKAEEEQENLFLRAFLTAQVDLFRVSAVWKDWGMQASQGSLGREPRSIPASGPGL